MKYILVVLLSVVSIYLVYGGPTTASTTIKPAQNDSCSTQKNCKDCTSMKVKCLWCSSPKPHCKRYSGGIPSRDECPLTDANYFSCSINVLTLIICMVCVGVVVILMTICCIYCCCCRGGNARMRKKLAKEEARHERERNERLAANADKRAEREKKRDEIRTKYGLKKNDVPYTRFDD